MRPEPEKVILTVPNKKKSGDGNRCPRCRQVMTRWRHPDGWVPIRKCESVRLFWDRCPSCGHLHFYKATSIPVEDWKALADEPFEVKQKFVRVHWHLKRKWW